MVADRPKLKAKGKPPLPPVNHQERIADLRAKYQICMERPEYWWIQDEVIATIGKALEQRNFVVVDSFMGQPICKQLRAELKAVYEKGVLSPGGLAGGRTGASLQYQMQNVRGDYMGWFTGKESELGWKRLPELMTKVDTIVNELKDSGHAAGLQRIDSRSNAMCTCYPGEGAHYIRHCDNPNINGRVLTAIYYMNTEWQPEDGGQLRIYSCLKDAKSAEGFTDCDGVSLHNWDTVHPDDDQLSTGEASQTLGAPGVLDRGTVEGSAGEPQTSAVRVADVEPLGDRLLLFYSDKRVPHEVLPAKSFRYAITTWFMSSADAAEARAKFQHQKEAQAIQEEIASMQKKYGGHAVVHDVYDQVSQGPSPSTSYYTAEQSEERPIDVRDAFPQGTPDFELFERTDPDGVVSLELVVRLPGVTDIQDVIVDVGPRRLKVEAPPNHMLKLNLPQEVDDKAGRASFKRRNGHLTVILPLVGGAPTQRWDKTSLV